MEKFALFAFIFFVIAFLFLLGILVSILAATQKKVKMKPPVQYLTYNKQHFDRDFAFLCEYCGNEITTKNSKCMNCGAAYAKNKVYKNKKRETDLKYLEFLRNQEKQIQQEVAYIEKTLDALRKNKVMKSRFYNFELGEIPVYRPAKDFEFTCEYCDTKLRGRSTDLKSCSNCGAGYRENTDLLIWEEKEKLEKIHYVEYLKLKDIEWNQNIENIYDQKDVVLTKHARGIALLMLGAILLITFLFTALLMP